MTRQHDLETQHSSGIGTFAARRVSMVDVLGGVCVPKPDLLQAQRQRRAIPLGQFVSPIGARKPSTPRLPRSSAPCSAKPSVMQNRFRRVNFPWARWLKTGYHFADKTPPIGLAAPIKRYIPFISFMNLAGLDNDGTNPVTPGKRHTERPRKKYRWAQRTSIFLLVAVDPLDHFLRAVKRLGPAGLGGQANSFRESGKASHPLPNNLRIAF